MIYCICLCIIFTVLGCNQPQKQSVTVESLHKLLRPVDSELYVGFNPKLNTFYMVNRYVQRWMRLDKENGVLATTALIDNQMNTNWLTSQRHALLDEFRFQIGKTVFTGQNGKLKYKDYDIRSYPNAVKELIVSFEYREEDKLAFDLAVHYEIDSDTPVIRKWLEFDNLTDRAFSVEELEIESLRLSPESLQIYDFQSNELSEIEDNGPLIVAYAQSTKRGLLLSSNIPGALKSYQIEDNKISIGLQSSSSPWRTEINVHAHERKASPRAFIMPLGNLADGTWQSTWLKFVRRYFTISSRLRETVSTVAFTDIDEKVSVESNAELICVDWNLGKMELERLAEMSKKVHDNQRKFGVRVNLTTVNAELNVTDDWLFRKHNGKEWISSSDDAEKEHFCLASEYALYVANYLRYLVDKVNLDYLVFDGAVFGPNEKNIGCASYRHGHSGPADSVMLIYQNLFNIADSLHQDYQKLAIAISSKTYAANLPDCALLPSIDGFVFDSEKSDIKVSEITKVFPQEAILTLSHFL